MKLLWSFYKAAIKLSYSFYKPLQTRKTEVRRKYALQHDLLTFATRALEQGGLLVTEKVHSRHMLVLGMRERMAGYWWQLAKARNVQTYAEFWKNKIYLIL